MGGSSSSSASRSRHSSLLILISFLVSARFILATAVKLDRDDPLDHRSIATDEDDDDDDDQDDYCNDATRLTTNDDENLLFSNHSGCQPARLAGAAVEEEEEGSPPPPAASGAERGRSQPAGSSALQIAWLLSFPNSGTTYTLQAVQQMSNRSAAANTCLLWVHKEAVSVPIRTSMDNSTMANHKSTMNDLPRGGSGGDNDHIGPYQISPNRSLPDTYILTRTHCAGHYPWPWRRTISSNQFARACGQTAIVNRYGRKIARGSYRHTIVAKAIHLWRHPIDNVIARYRHARRYIPKWVLPNVFWYCRLTDRLNWDRLVSSPSWFPCQTELHRYVTWHNNAMELAETIHPQLQVLHIYYEDYDRRPNNDKSTDTNNDDDDDDHTTSSLTTILNYLVLPQVEGPKIRFKPSTHHRDQFYFTRQHQTPMMAYLQENASPRVWEKLQRYDSKNNDDDHTTSGY